MPTPDSSMPGTSPSDAARPDLSAEAVKLLSKMTSLQFTRGVDQFGTAERFLATADWRENPRLTIAVARLVDGEFAVHALEKLATDLAGSPLVVDELRVVFTLDIAANLIVADVRHSVIGDDDAMDDPVLRLSAFPAYVAFAETGLKKAAERIRSIHKLEIPYASDKAFAPEECSLVARLARLALARDEAWVAPVLDELFRKVSLAPTAAKSVPSQSLAIALGHAVEAFPTPEAVATLRGVLDNIRHAGVEKKLQRNLRGAERGLAGRPEIALRLPADQPISKSQLTTLAHALEGGLALRMELAYDDWRSRLADRPQAKNLAASLVWRFLDADGGNLVVLPVIERGRTLLQDIGGAPVTPASGSRVMLWHPTDASAAERGAWRDRLAALRIKQPFKQVFREHYVVPPDELCETSCAMFSGHAVSVVPLLGLARKERWRLDDDRLTRSFGPWWAKLDIADEIYPGYAGTTTIKGLSLWQSGGGSALPARLGDIPAAILSEILRAVDLLVSASGFGLAADDDDPARESRLRYLSQYSVGAMTDMRKEALARMFRGLDGMADWRFEARHLRVGPYAIHLATGRLTRDGEPVAIEVPKRASLPVAPWLPYDEKLLETIFLTAIEIAKRIV
jgi:hypothetical protein